MCIAERDWKHRYKSCRDRQSPDRNLNQAPPENKPKAFPYTDQISYLHR
jgi:hypothetical protein